MSDAIDPNANVASREEILLDRAFNIFVRCLSLAFFVFSVITWALAVGIWEGDNFRFDTMSQSMKVYIAVLAVLNPVTCVGLWTTLPWGRVIWFMAIGFQCTFLFRLPGAIEGETIIIAFHMVCLAIYLILELLQRRIEKKE